LGLHMAVLFVRGCVVVTTFVNDNVVPVLICSWVGVVIDRKSPSSRVFHSVAT
jgi:hypothetical protein